MIGVCIIYMYMREKDTNVLLRSVVIIERVSKTSDELMTHHPG